MSTVSTRALKDQLSSYLQRAEAGEQIVVLRDGRPVAALVPISQVREMDEQARLSELAARGLVSLPARATPIAFQGPAVPSRGTLASEMILEDRGNWPPALRCDRRTGEDLARLGTELVTCFRAV